MLIGDTTAEARAVQLAIHRRLSPAERLRQAMEMSDAVRRFAVAGLRLRHPEYSESEIAQALVTLLYGERTR
jgi:Rv0078B-related antitoxin